LTSFAAEDSAFCRLSLNFSTDMVTGKLVTVETTMPTQWIPPDDRLSPTCTNPKLDLALNDESMMWPNRSDRKCRPGLFLGN
jgi:hypothetical protein